ncbi:MAG: hypothetical protein O3B01_21795 [Planctomycetota bacterium]|nr:hypothetical protein [Planctomycetota bacterium]MDA1141208.1 hypothetical protein [Planctomycetota bacterium]
MKMITRLSTQKGNRDLTMDLRPFVSGGLHGGLVQLEVGGQHSGDSNDWAEDEKVSFPGTTFQQLRVDTVDGTLLYRTVISRPGYFLCIFDSVTAGNLDYAWPDSPAILKTENFGSNAGTPAPQLCLFGRMEEANWKVDLAGKRFIRLARMREGYLIGLGTCEGETILRNIRLKAEAFWLNERAFSLLNATSLSYSGRLILESPKPVSLEIDVITGTATLQGTPGSHAILHGGNLSHEVDLFDGQTELEITGFSRKSDWWNVVMAAVKNL